MKKTTKVIATLMLAFIGMSQVASAASEFTGTLTAARSTDSMTEYQGSLQASAGSGASVEGTNDDDTASTLNRSGGRRGGGGGGTVASTGGSSGGFSTDNIIIVPEQTFASSGNSSLTGTGGGFSPEAERAIAAAGTSNASAGTGGADTDTTVSSEDILALNTGQPNSFLGSEQTAAAERAGLGTGTIALIALGTIALVAAIGYGVNAALGMRQNDRL